MVDFDASGTVIRTVQRHGIQSATLTSQGAELADEGRPLGCRQPGGAFSSEMESAQTATFGPDTIIIVHGKAALKVVISRGRRRRVRDYAEQSSEDRKAADIFQGDANPLDPAASAGRAGRTAVSLHTIRHPTKLQSRGQIELAFEQDASLIARHRSGVPAVKPGTGEPELRILYPLQQQTQADAVVHVARTRSPPNAAPAVKNEFPTVEVDRGVERLLVVVQEPIHQSLVLRGKCVFTRDKRRPPVSANGRR